MCLDYYKVARRGQQVADHIRWRLELIVGVRLLSLPGGHREVVRN